MANLASIPERPNASLDYSIPNPRRQRAPVFERSRPRSRVLVISRPSRLRKQSRHTLSSGPQKDAPDENTDPGASIKRSATMSDNLTWRPSSPIQSVSDLDSPPGSVFEPSDLSVDLDSFPHPPSIKKGWPLPDPENHMDNSQQAEATFFRRARSPPKLVSHANNRHVNTFTMAKAIDKAHADRHRGSISDNAARASRSPRDSSVDTDLVEAISRSVAEQLRLFTTVRSRQASPRKSRKPSVDHQDKLSRTSSQRKALDRFTKELHRYANNVNAKGQEPACTSVSSTPATLRTVSALLPYRSEFKAAGLAVTSHDQAQRSPQKTKAETLRENRRLPSHMRASQFDGMDGNQESLSRPSTKVDFAGSHVDEWRRALIDEVPPRRRQVPGGNNQTRWRCFPRFQKKQLPLMGEDDPQVREDDRSYVATGEQDSIEVAYPKRRGFQYRLFPREEPRVMRPKGYHAIPDPDSRKHKLTPAVSVPTFSRKHIGLQRRSTTVGLSNEHGESGKGGRPHNRGYPPNPTDDQPPKAQGVTPLDLLPEQLSRLELHRFAQRQYQSMPTNQADSPLPNRLDAESMLEPEMPLGHKQRTKTAPQVSGSRRPIQAGILPLRSRAVMAAQEIARHSLGPYQRIPKSRRVSALSKMPPPKIPSRKSSIKMRRQSQAADFHSISDRDVLKGLHIAAAAACDEEIDGFVHDKTGVHIRRFLADLIAFESLGLEKADDDPEERAKRRRQQLKKLKQHVRKSREVQRESSSPLKLCSARIR